MDERERNNSRNHSGRFQTGTKTEFRAGHGRWMAVAAVAAAILAGAFLLFLCFRKSKPYETDEAAMDSSYEMTISPEAQKMAEEVESRKEAAANSSVEIQINGEATVDAVTGRCNLMIGNPDVNERDFCITLTLDEDGSIIYQSPVIKPGSRIAYVTLDKKLESGEYTATAEFAVLDPESGAAVGAVDAGIRLLVE